MESPKNLVPVVMMSVTALASSSLPAQASQSHPSADQLQQECPQRLKAVLQPGHDVTDIPHASTVV